MDTRLSDEKAVKEIKMASLHFVDFALIPGPARKENQFRLPDDFSEFYFTILQRTSQSASGFLVPFRVFTSQNFWHDEGEAGNISTSHRLIAAII